MYEPLLIGSGNRGKAAELAELLQGLPSVDALLLVNVHVNDVDAGPRPAGQGDVGVRPARPPCRDGVGIG